MKVVVLAGGYSLERDVSMTSGCLIANALCRNGHEVALLDVYQDITISDPTTLFTQNGDYTYQIPDAVPNLEELRKERNMGNRLIGRGIMDVCLTADMVFLALHGGMGEDGRIQAMLECHGIPFTGSSFGACYCAMDKAKAKALVQTNQVPVPKGFIYCGQDASVFPLPCVIKPNSLGSSVGVSMVDTVEQLTDALNAARHYGTDALIEERIFGREFSCGVLNGKALPPIEIRPKEGFYDYTRKYQSGLTEEICPAPITKEQTKRMGDLALAAGQALGLTVYYRIDFILNEKTGDFVFLEANTLPGMTPMSLLPQEARVAGITYEEVVETILQQSKKQFEDKGVVV